MKYKLEELCEFITDGTHQTPEYCEDGGVKFLSSKDVTARKIDWDNVKYIPESLHEKLYARLSPRKDDILLAKNGTTGVAALVDRDEIFDVYVSLAVLRPKNIVYPKYLLYAINSSVAKRQFDAGLKGVGVPNLHLSVIRKTEINIEEYEKQLEVCGVLDKVVSIIDARKEELQQLDKLIKARFVELFGNKGENPNGYSEDTLGNLYKFQYGKGNNIPEDKGEYPCYGSNGIVGHHTEFNSEDAPIIGHIGAYAGIVNWGEGKHYVTYNGVICKLRTDRINPIYGFYLLQQQDFNRVATKGGGQPFVSYGDLESPTVVVPPIEIQNDYAAFAKQVDKSKVAVQAALDKAQLLFDSLMQKYFG